MSAADDGQQAGLNEPQHVREPGQAYYNGKLVVCPHCGGCHFAAEPKLLATAGAALMGVEWANTQATTLTCIQCSHIEWFRTPPA